MAALAHLHQELSHPLHRLIVPTRAQKVSAHCRFSFWPGAQPSLLKRFAERFAGSGFQRVFTSEGRDRYADRTDHDIAQAYDELISLLCPKRFVQQPDRGLFFVLRRELPLVLYTENRATACIPLLFVVRLRIVERELGLLVCIV